MGTMKRLIVAIMFAAAVMWTLPALASDVRPPGIQGGAGPNPWWGQSGFDVRPIAPVPTPPPGDVEQPALIYPKPVCCFVVR